VNLFIKKLLAKYIIYIEVIGYGFVLIFIGGLIALSFIKAEDEFVPLKGQYNIKTSLIRFDQKQIILDLISGPTPFVQPGDLLAHVTGDRKFVSDHIIKKTLKEQIETAQEIPDINLAERLTSLLSEINERTYPDMKIIPVTSPISGEIFLLKGKDDIVLENEIIGGVFDFIAARIYVSEFPVDRQQKRKLKLGQSGTATIDLGFENPISFSVKMVGYSEKKMVFQPENMSFEKKQKMAQIIFQENKSDKILANINLRVGSRSWMSLIWQ